MSKVVEALVETIERDFRCELGPETAWFVLGERGEALPPSPGWVKVAGGNVPLQRGRTVRYITLRWIAAAQREAMEDGRVVFADLENAAAKALLERLDEIKAQLEGGRPRLIWRLPEKVSLWSDEHISAWHGGCAVALRTRIAFPDDIGGCIRGVAEGAASNVIRVPAGG